MSKLTNITLGVCFGLLTAGPLAMAQIPQANAYFGLGTATADSNGQAIDPFGIGRTFNTPRLTGLFADVGGSLMLTPHFGAGAQISWRAGEGNYAGLNYRPMFYDFNAIWQPVKTRHFVPELQAGLGGARLRFSANTQQCDQLVGCSTVSLGEESSNHFATHVAAAVRLYATPHIFVRPAVDVHWVNNNFQFGSNWVPQYSIGVGYSFGGE
jgi:hypothetical protein